MSAANSQYLVWNNHSPLQSTQVDGEALPQMFEEGQVQRDPTQCVKHTKHLTRYSAGGEVAVACKRDDELSLYYRTRGVQMLHM